MAPIRTSLASILLAVIALSGCARRHYAVCMAGSGGSGCSHWRFDQKTANSIGALLASQPISEEVQIWIIDVRKYPVVPKETPEVPPVAAPTKKEPDTTIKSLGGSGTVTATGPGLMQLVQPLDKTGDKER